MYCMWVLHVLCELQNVFTSGDNIYREMYNGYETYNTILVNIILISSVILIFVIYLESYGKFISCEKIILMCQ